MAQKKRSVRRKLISLLLAAVVTASALPLGVLAATYPSGSKEVSGDLLSVVLSDVQDDTVTLDNQSELQTPVATNPAQAAVGISCGGCGGDCGDFCADQWGFCHCMGSYTVTPEVLITTPSDTSVAIATLTADGKLKIVAVNNGTTSVTLKARVQSKSNGTIQGERYSPAKTVSIVVKNIAPRTILDAPAGLSFTDDTLSWDAVAHADSYSVTATNGSDATVTASKTTATNSLDVTAFSPELKGGNYTFTVTAYPADGDAQYVNSLASAASESHTLPPVKLAAPQNVVYNPVAGKVSWTAVPGTDGGYQVKLTSLDGQYSTTSTAYQNSMNLSTGTQATDTMPAGDYAITVTAIGAPAHDEYSYDANWNMTITHVPQAYATSDPSDPAPTRYTVVSKALQTTNFNSTPDGKTVLLNFNYPIDLSKFYLSDSGVTFKVNGVKNPLVRVQRAGTDGKLVAFTFQNAFRYTDQLSFVIDGGTLQTTDGVGFSGYAVEQHTYMGGGQVLPGNTALVFGSGSFGQYTQDDEGRFAFDLKTSYVRDKVYDSKGNLYYADGLPLYTDSRKSGYAVRRVDAVTGVVTTVAGTGAAPAAALAADAAQPALSTPVSPTALALSPDERTLYIGSVQGDQSTAIFQIYALNLASGTIRLAAGNGSMPLYIPNPNGTGTIREDNGDGGDAKAAKLGKLMSLAVDSDGNLYFSEQNTYRIRKVDKTTGVVSTVAGTGSNDWQSKDADGQSTIAALNAANGSDGTKAPTSVSINPTYLKIRDDVLYFTDNTAKQIRKFDLKAANPVVEVAAGAPNGSSDALAPAGGMDVLKANFVSGGNALDDFTFSDTGTLYFLSAYQKSGENSSMLLWQVNSDDGTLVQITKNGNVLPNPYSPVTTNANLGLKINYTTALDYHDGQLTLYSEDGSSYRGLLTVDPYASQPQKLDTPTGLKISGDTLTWNPVPRAERYQITVTPKDGGDPVVYTTVRDTSYPFSQPQQKLPAEDYSVTVTALPMYSSLYNAASDPSAPVDYTGKSYQADHVVVAEVYGGGGVSGSAYHNDYVKLYNPTNEIVDLTGWSVQSFSASTNEYQGTFKLTGKILPHGYYLVSGASFEDDKGGALPTPDVSDPSIDIQSMNVRVALLDSTERLTGITDSHLVDLIGVDGVLYEGTYLPTALKPKSLLTSVVRKNNNGDTPDGSKDLGNGWDTGYTAYDIVLSDKETPENTSDFDGTLADAVTGQPTVSGSLADSALTAVPSGTFRSPYSGGQVAKTYYYWYVDGKLAAASDTDATLSTAGLQVGGKLKLGVQYLFQDGTLSNVTFSDEKTLQAPDIAPAQVSGSYTVFTGHQAPLKTGDATTDDQSITLNIPFDKKISLNDASALLAALSINFGGTDLKPTTYADEITVLPDGKTLQLVMHFPFAAYGGQLVVTAGDLGGSLTTQNAFGPAVTFPSVNITVSNGVTLTNAKYVVGTGSTPASVTKTVDVPSSATRGMVHLKLLKNGQQVGTADTWGASFTAHFHLYLTLDSKSFASTIVQAMYTYSQDENGSTVQTELFPGYSARDNGDGTITITEDNAVSGDVIDLQVVGYGVVNTQAPQSNPGGSPDGGDSGDADTGKQITLSDSTTGVRLTAPAGVVPDGASLQVQPVPSGDFYEAAGKALANIGTRFALYHISLLLNGAAVEPSGSVSVSLPIPTGYDTSRLAVYRINDDGTATRLEGHVDGDFYVFTTDRFSDYALVQTSADTSSAGSDTSSGSEVQNPDTGLGAPGGSAAVPAALLLLCAAAFLARRKVHKD